MSEQEPTSRQTVKLSRIDYETLLAAADDIETDLVVRLCGEVGLTPVEIVNVRYEHLKSPKAAPEATQLLVPTISNSEAERCRPRTAYIPSGVAHQLFAFGRSNENALSAPLFDYSKRTIQGWISTITDKAASDANDQRLGHVSAEDLRSYFVRRMVYEHDVDPMVVKRLGGWNKLESLEKHLVEPSNGRILTEWMAKVQR